MRLRHRRVLLGLAVSAYAAYKVTSLSSDPYAAHTKMPVLAPYYEEPPPRTEQLKKIIDDKLTYDIIVVGGGITGAGVALDAATRGLRVCLLEANDFMSETSSRSTKLIHGGIRYLELAFRQLDWRQLALVYEALREREHLMSIGPHLSRSLPIMIPAYSWFDLAQMYVGVKMYDLLAGSKTVDRSSFMTARRALTKYPLLRGDGLKGALVYHDGQHDDARMGLSVVLTAAQHGASVANYCRVTRLIHEPNAGRVRGVEAKDTLTGRTFTVRGNVVVNATGVFADSVINMDKAPSNSASNPDYVLKATAEVSKKRGQRFQEVLEATSMGVKAAAAEVGGATKGGYVPERSDLKAKREAAEAIKARPFHPVISASAGAHVTLPLLFCPGGDMGVLVRTSDKRVLFLLPWEGVAVAGTTDVPCEVVSNPRPQPSDVPFILRELTSFLHPSIRAQATDVLSAWAGIRPLVRIDAFEKPSGAPAPSQKDGEGTATAGKAASTKPTTPSTRGGGLSSSSPSDSAPAPEGAVGGAPGLDPAVSTSGASSHTVSSGGEGGSQDTAESKVSGWRKAVGGTEKKGTANVARSHYVHTSPSGLVSIVGGKWTTYRAMAEDAVNASIRAAHPPLTHAAACRTRKLPLYGSIEWTPRDAVAFMHDYGIDGSTAKHVSRTFGDRARAVLDAAAADTVNPFEKLVPPSCDRPQPSKRTKSGWTRGSDRQSGGSDADVAERGPGGAAAHTAALAKLPYLAVEVDRAVDVEFAQTVIDVIARRTRLAFIDARAAAAAVPAIADRMATRLDWTPERKRSEIRQAQEFVEGFQVTASNTDAFPAVADVKGAV